MSNIHELNCIVDSIFDVLEEVKSMFARWDNTCHTAFVERVFYLNELRSRLNKLGYSDDFVDTVLKVAYDNVFGALQTEKG
ncbi:MAG: hypothetical protein ACRDIV_06655 [Ktedonobacteraceae bacterium]